MPTPLNSKPADRQGSEGVGGGERLEKLQPLQFIIPAPALPLDSVKHCMLLPAAYVHR